MQRPPPRLLRRSRVSILVKAGLLPSFRSQQGKGSPDLIKVAGYGVRRSTGTGLVGPRMGDDCVETEILLPHRRYDFLLRLFLLLCDAIGGISWFARVVGATAASEPDPSSLPSRRGTYIDTQSHRWRRLVQACWMHMYVHIFSARE